MVANLAFDTHRHPVFLVAGMQWGDEGKGKLVAALARGADIVAKYNGGHNAGHEVVVDGITHKFHAMPCGALLENTVNILGNGVVVHMKSLLNEIKTLEDRGIDITERLFISTRAHLIFNIHFTLDQALEDHRSNSNKDKIGTTLKGIGPCYATRCSRTGVMVGHMFHWESFETKVKDLFEIHCDSDDAIDKARVEIEEHKEYFKKLSRCIIDTEYYLTEAIEQGKRVLLEGANGSLLDLALGTYPFVTSSNTLTSGVYNGLGLSPSIPIFRIGVIKCYQTRIGLGPFPTELFDSNLDHISTVGSEFGVTTGRKRRCGWLDIPAARYAQRLNDFHCLNLTKLDVLTGLKTIKICIDYKSKKTGVIMKRGSFPDNEFTFSQYEPVYHELPGWDTNLTNVRSYDQLPNETRNFVEYVQEQIGVFIQWNMRRLELVKSQEQTSQGKLQINIIA